VLNTAIANAQQAMTVTNVSQSAVNGHETAIQTAINNLVLVPFAGGKLTSLPTEIVSNGLMGYWDTGGRTNEADSLTTLPDISGNNWTMGMKGLNGTTTSGYISGYGLQLDGINDLLMTTSVRPMSSTSVSFESV